jgi:maltooligosyltrehalose trehalohydrolase
LHRFKVWAPNPERVDLVVDGRERAMQRDELGWWRATDEDAGTGSRYGFRLDGGPARPDPRSAGQPDGPDGLSEVIDHGAFVWSDSGWRGMPLRGAVLYELHVGTFTPAGTFDSALEKLPLLVDLGVDAVELMPVAEFPGERGWGYDVVDLFAPHHAYGGPDGLKRFVDACHLHGLGVVIDVVYNHLGPSGNYLPQFGPYFSERHETNWGAAVNFDGKGSEEVRRFVIDNALSWFADYHADGLRLDAVHAIIDHSAVHVLEQMAEEVDALSAHLHRHLHLVAESDLNDPRFVRSPDAGGYGLDAAWADEWHHALHAALTGDSSGYYEDFGSLEHLAKALSQAWVYDGTWSPHRGRRHGRPPTGLPGHRFVVFTQNHDQVGNRALGERSSALMSEGRLRTAAALLFCAPFTPMLFQGEEWGATSPFLYFTDHSDPDLGRAVTEGRRNEFSYWGADPDGIPDPQDPSTFENSKLQWAERDRDPHRGLLEWHKQLIALRRAFPELSDPRVACTAVHADDEHGTLVMRRGAFRVAVNISAEARKFEFDARYEILMSSESGLATDGAGLVIPGDSVAILRVS